ncbi:hypothetical protein O181_009243 [Austropuccinia psidii MF-1]|uniref:Uncharacterized protein n=1 Tax=Austropuccinia psidii MF-1 TaxID=1389203 RepID=A0A9Q3BQZ4_9BASI|nr:hypothetical protein [Austropuccinia psidii MF-1]
MSSSMDLRPESSSDSNPSPPPKRAPGLLGVLKRHIRFIGPGIVTSAAYYDPGNWATNIQAGSLFGNIHLFVLLLAICLAIFLQILATRLGFVSRKDISQNCRAVLYSQPQKKTWFRSFLLYSLWLLFEVGILFADMGELLGSTIAYTLLIPQLPVWAATLLTFPEVFLALLFFRKGKRSRRSMQLFEIMITLVVMIVVVSSLILMFKVKPNFLEVFKGYIPQSKLISGTALYTAIGILGATVGPHSIILGATMATQDSTYDDHDQVQKSQTASKDLRNLNPSIPDPEKQSYQFPSLENPTSSTLSTLEEPSSTSRSLLGCKSYLAHASFDIAASIFTLPLIVNSAILVASSTEFFYTKKPGAESTDQADITSMHALLKTNLGPGFATLFAISLLLSGQAASLTITIAGQSVSEGFLQRQISPLMRRLITRTLGIIPAVIISALSGKDGISSMLIATQVAISIFLPFAIIPLAYFAARKDVMSISMQSTPQPFPTNEPFKHNQSISKTQEIYPIDKQHVIKNQNHHVSFPFRHQTELSNPEPPKYHSFANGKIVNIIVCLIVVIVLVSNTYGIYQAVASD